MPVVAAAAIGAVGAGLAAKSSSNAQKSAANAVQQSNDAATAEQRRQYDLSRADNAPWLAAGQNALGQLTALNSGDLSGFNASPDYNFRLNEQNRSLAARNSALGIQDSGAAQKAALKYSGNLASGEFSNYANRLSALAGVGQTAASQNQALGTNYANAITGINQSTGQALSSSYQNQGAINSGLFQNIAGIGAGLANGYGTQWGGNSGGGGWTGSSLPNSAFRW